MASVALNELDADSSVNTAFTIDGWTQGADDLTVLDAYLDG